MGLGIDCSVGPGALVGQFGFHLFWKQKQKDQRG